MIKIQNQQIDNETVEIINELLDKEISIVAAFKLSRIVKELNNIIKDKTEAEVKLVNSFAKKDEDGKILLAKDEQGNEIPSSFEIETSKMELFQKEMENFMLIETTINQETLDINELKLSDDIKFTVKKIMKIDFLFSR